MKHDGAGEDDLRGGIGRLRQRPALIVGQYLGGGGGGAVFALSPCRVGILISEVGD